MKGNAKNERVKRRYYIYLKEARQLDEQSIDAVAAAIDRFDTFNRRRDFHAYRPEQAVSFKRDLEKQTNRRTGERLSKSTIHSTLNALKEFFFWLAGQPGFKSRFTYSDADYFKASLKDVAIAKADRDQAVPTLDQIRQAIAAMPNGTPIEMRNRALIAFAALTGARDNAIASTLLKHVDLAGRRLFQDARHMRTKYAKSFATYFFPVGEEMAAILEGWIDYLRIRHGFGPDDPLFPPIKMVFQVGGTKSTVLERRCWSSAARIRAIFKNAFGQVGLPPFQPHSVRKTIVRLGLELGIGEAGLKAWSQNLGHEGVLTTLKSYGELPDYRQRDLIRASASAGEDDVIALRIGRDALRSIRETGVK